MDDNILMMYIDEVFQVYDHDRNGTLDVKQIHHFFNQLYASLNQSRRFNQQQIMILFKSIDKANDNRITKPQLFILFKSIWANPGLTVQQIAGLNRPQYIPNNYNQNQYVPNQYNSNQGQQPYNQNSPYNQGQQPYNPYNQNNNYYQGQNPQNYQQQPNNNPNYHNNPYQYK